MPVPAGGVEIVVQREAPGWVAIGSAHRMGALVMQAVIERLADNAPLHREVAAAAKVMRAVNGPAQRTMVHDRPVHVFGVERVIASFGAFGFVLVAQPEAEIADDDVGRVFNLERVVPEGDAIARRRLAGDSDIRFVQQQSALKLNRS